MRKNNFHRLAQEWFQKAEDDWGTALLLRQEKSYPSSICFHLHQAAEKYLKGFLVWHGKDIKDEFKIHNLLKLYEYSSKINPHLDENVKEGCFTLNRYYIFARYPGDVPEYPWKEVDEAIAAAKIIKQTIEKST